MIYFVLAVATIATALYLAVLATVKLCDYFHEVN